MGISFKMDRVITSLIVIFLTGLYGCGVESERKEYAEMLIEKVEAYRGVNHQLPKDVSEIGLVEEMDSLAFYQKETDSTYIVWYGLGLGESKIYRSMTKTWTEGG